MSSSASARAIVISALILGGVYAYRWLTGGKSQAHAKISPGPLVGLGPQVTPEGFLVAWGVIYLSLGLASELAPALAGAFAVLIALSTLIANFLTVSGSVSGLISSKNVAVSNGGPESSAEGVSNLAASAQGAFNEAGALVSGAAPAVLARAAVAKATGGARRLESELVALNHEFAARGKHFTQQDVNEVASGKVSVAQLRKALREVTTPSTYSTAKFR